jgi:MFS family permease
MSEIATQAATPHQRAALATYVVGAALTSTAYIATFQNASVAAPALTGSASAGGLPSSAAVAGTAIAAAALSALMAVRGRRVGIVSGVAIAVIGSALTVAAIAGTSFWILLLGSLLIGFGNAAINLSRYAAADLVPPGERAGAVGLVVWGSTVGAVAGPNLVAPANAIGEAAGLSHFAGAFVMSAGILLLAVLIATLGPRPRREPSPPGGESSAPRLPIRALAATLLGSAVGRTAVLALVSGQLVMVLVMTMTPYHLNHTGHGDATIGLVISSHMFGMFALSPLSGRLTRRFGASRVIAAGFVTLTAAGLLAAAIPNDGGTALMVPLFLLGFGWNMGFVAGSTLLSSGGAFADRARLQGVVDAAIWGTAALAGVAAGPVVEWAGYGVLCLLGAALAVVLAGLVGSQGRGAALSAQPPAPGAAG